jgi:hypothetical protein
MFTLTPVMNPSTAVPSVQVYVLPLYLGALADCLDLEGILLGQDTVALLVDSSSLQQGCRSSHPQGCRGTADTALWLQKYTIRFQSEARNPSPPAADTA